MTHAGNVRMRKIQSERDAQKKIGRDIFTECLNTGRARTLRLKALHPFSARGGRLQSAHSQFGVWDCLRAQSIIDCELIPIKAHWTATNGPREMPQGARAFNFFCLFRWENV